jgi:FKBP-type peptidyl-prolyl cis-trans isomerase FkpA
MEFFIFILISTMKKHISLSLLLFVAWTGFAWADKTIETLPSGVKVEHLKPGTGASPTAADTVVAHYRGTLLDGKEFDSSYKRGEPIAFPLSRVIPCWTEGMQKIKIGGKARLTCPPETAYGAEGVRGVIPPKATLLFEVELVGIKKN